MLARIGAVEVWRVLESEGPLMPVARFFPDLAPQDLARLRPGLPPGAVADDPATGEPWVVLPVQAFLLRTPRALILVDACVGNRKTVVHIPQWNDRRDGRFLAGLAAAGARPEDVDVVLCTHLHVDHAGWTTRRVDGRWVPTFPNARVLASAEDLAHARAQAEAQPDATAGALWRETLAPLLEAGRLDARPLARMAEAEIDPALRLIPTPGHTPGHVSVLIRGEGSGGGEGAGEGAGDAAVTGDLIHSPLQCALPDLCPVVDADPAAARATRAAFLAESARTRRLTFASHFPLPSAGRFRRDGDAFAWEPAF